MSTEIVPPKVIALVDALKSVVLGIDVYHALTYVPTENLQNMQDMIVTILKRRGE